MLFIIQIIRVFKWFHTQFQAPKKFEVNLNSLAFSLVQRSFSWDTDSYWTNTNKLWLGTTIAFSLLGCYLMLKARKPLGEPMGMLWNHFEASLETRVDSTSKITVGVAQSIAPALFLNLHPKGAFCSFNSSLRAWGKIHSLNSIPYH